MPLIEPQILCAEWNPGYTAYLFAGKVHPCPVLKPRATMERARILQMPGQLEIALTGLSYALIAMPKTDE